MPSLLQNTRPKSEELKALESYWRSKMRGAVPPARRDIDPWEMCSSAARC